jgi:hypothetical protein
LSYVGDGKKQQQTKKTSSETSLLYYKVGKDGIITNYQAWLQGWMEHEITEFDVIFQEGLRELKRKEFDLKAELQGLEYQPMVTILKEFWVPTRVEHRELEAETNDVRRSYMECRMIAEWAEEQAKINATIRATNNTIKRQHDAKIP